MRTITYGFFFFFILSIMTSCKEKGSKVEPEFKLASPDNLDDNEYQIYSVILNENFEGNELLVEQKTSSLRLIINSNYYETLKAENLNLDTAIFVDFDAKNSSTYYLNNKFETPTKSVTLISEEEKKYFASSQDPNNGWDAFHKKYPKSNGIIQFSRIGFNVDKNQAIVEVSRYYASLGASGHLIYLVRENNSWRIIKTINTWVS
ncbi:hypothetical protein JCM21142_41374 [Sporocytophaga myxococcoides]|uniref:Uncharacterized protein n=1 Tax=Sporocytophaga myxococcoides TaxID=153721 RepID=A0A098LK97_9BACT|nr:hypothetical protein [Sporocytophaga myxococcoides]GAL87390.1 hypothetical protein JCM21142_41374 [Sporocytophaga myxococcoides]